MCPSLRAAEVAVFNKFYHRVYPILRLALVSSFSWAAFPFWLLNRPRNGGPRRSSDFHDPVTRSVSGLGEGATEEERPRRGTRVSVPILSAPRPQEGGAGLGSSSLSQGSPAVGAPCENYQYLVAPWTRLRRRGRGAPARAPGPRHRPTGGRKRRRAPTAPVSWAQRCPAALLSSCHVLGTPQSTGPLEDLPPPSPQHTYKPQ